ncbi:hypothetical protein QAD02_011734, partial [Eretmocerus hayati]
PRPISDAFQRVKEATVLDVKLYQDWLVCWEERRAFFNATGIEDVFIEIPILKTATGLDLPMRDFAEVYPTHAANLMKNWSDLSRFVISHAQSLSSNSKLQGLLVAASEIEGPPVCQQFLALRSLPYMLGSYQCVPASKEYPAGWRASIEEVSASFIGLVRIDLENNEEYEVHVEAEEVKLRELYTKHGVSVGPHLIACGTNPIKCTYVVIGSHKVRVDGEDSPLRAADLCFKCSAILKVSLCKAAVNVWKFLESFAYGIPIGRTTSVSKLIELIENRRRIILEYEGATLLSNE